MNYAYVIFALSLGWVFREWYLSRQKQQLANQLGKARRALGKEKLKNAAKISKKRAKNYHDFRDAYGRFKRGGGKGGNA